MDNKLFSEDIEEALKSGCPIKCYELAKKELARAGGELFDYSSAAYWMKKAAEGGLAAAQNDLGVFYYEGMGVKQSFVEAFKWYEKSADQGNADALFNLGGCYYYGQGTMQSYDEASRLWKEAANKNHMNAMFNLGCCYANGEGVEQSDEKTVKLWERATRLGQKDAKECLEKYSENKSIKR